MFAAAVILLGMTGCSAEDNPSSNNVNVLEQSLVGLWWDEFEYADVTEAGVPFSRVLLVVKTDADHTGCIYLGAFDGTSDEPLAVYGGPEAAGFTWRLLPDGRVLLGDPVTGESYALTRSADDGSSFGNDMTNVASTSLNYTDGSVTVTNGRYSCELVKADAEKAAEIGETLSTLSPDRQNFEAQLSQMLADSQQYIKLDPTMRAVKLLTEFIGQLKISALKPQLINFLANSLTREGMGSIIDLTDPANEEARWALANSNVPNESATQINLLNAKVVLTNNAFVFTTGKDTAEYVTNVDNDAFFVSCKNTTSGATTKVRMKFSGADDGVIIVAADLYGTPLAIQFPHMIDLELLRSETGSDADEELIMKGQLMLETTDGKKFLSLKHGEWKGTLFTEAKKADRFELPAATLIHHADHTVEASATLGINDKNVMSIKGHNFNNPYTDEELEQLRELRDIAPIWKGCYTLLKAFNSRTDKIEMTVSDDLLFDIDILDAGQCLKAAGNALKYRGQQPSKETIDPWTDMLNKSVSYTVTQKSTGVKAEGKFITSVIDGDNLPSIALRFKGESDFRVIHDRMNPTDRQNYEALLKSFDEPFTAVNALLKVIQDKGEELKSLK
jgi:hypothetical protein